MSDTIEDLLFLTITIAVGFLLAVAFYESLATRDVLVARVQRSARSISHRWWVPATSYVLTVLIGIPFLVVLWTVVLELALIFVNRSESADGIAITAVGVVGGARLLAYLREKTAHELAKAIPMALLFLLLTGASIDLEERLEALADVDGTDLTSEMLTFLIFLEVGLRISTDTGRWMRTTWRQRRDDT